MDPRIRDLAAAADREAVERPLAKFLAAYAVPNASLALLDGSGRLVHCTGLTNLGVYQSIHQQPAWAGPHSSFRVGSVSKTLTAWAITKLADLGILPNMQALLRDYVDLERVPVAVEKGLVGYRWPRASATQQSESQSYLSSSGSYTGNDMDDYEPYAERRLRLADAADKATDRAMRKLVAAAMQTMTLPTGGQDLFRVLPP